VFCIITSEVQGLADFNHTREVADSSKHGNIVAHLSKIVYQDASVMYTINLLKMAIIFNLKFDVFD
jgi:hypothetical protein